MDRDYDEPRPGPERTALKSGCGTTDDRGEGDIGVTDRDTAAAPTLGRGVGAALRVAR
jgi:hypothetical protein